MDESAIPRPHLSEAWAVREAEKMGNSMTSYVIGIGKQDGYKSGRFRVFGALLVEQLICALLIPSVREYGQPKNEACTRTKHLKRV
ncbi:unnamed protein product [Linum trigynum]|uniref:Uncharacterized protein n=1 Tax=Linum trigynum TaxID=586398 RepID=A0AAV2EQJ3_9ROSI